MRCIVPKDFRKMVTATKETKPVMESTQARLLRKKEKGLSCLKVYEPSSLAHYY